MASHPPYSAYPSPLSHPSSPWPLALRQERAVHSAPRSAPDAPLARQHQTIRDPSCLCAARARILGSAGQNSLSWESSRRELQGRPADSSPPGTERNGSCSGCVLGQRTVHSFGVSFLACVFLDPRGLRGKRIRERTLYHFTRRKYYGRLLRAPVCSLELGESSRSLSYALRLSPLLFPRCTPLYSRRRRASELKIVVAQIEMGWGGRED
ncbi:hypothetical protein K438DRAFT_845459 [Mycena galopus ATCC 62051]|nr:hypothetical protein K438DRAFT_845459 [Mycena galopus ATCC 62051]